MQDEIFTIIQDDDETLEDYLERFSYILQRSKLKLDPSTIRTLFLRGLTNNARNNLNMLGQGDIFSKLSNIYVNYEGNFQENSIYLVEELEIKIEKLNLLMP